MNYHSLSRLTKDYFFGGPGPALARRDVIGLYLEKEQLQYVCLSMTQDGWASKSPGPAIDPSGKVQEPAPQSLKQFLEWLNVVPLEKNASPPRKKAIYLALSRNNFSARDIQLPPMPMEDALSSVENSLSVSCHLPLEEIYYDIHLCRINQGNINALILYAPRKDMDAYLDVFREANLLDSLRGIFPVSLGIGAWLDLHLYSMPIGLVLPQDNVYEMAVYQTGGCLLSGTWPVSEGKQGGKILSAAVKSKFQGLNGNIFHMGGDSAPQLPLPPSNHLDQMPSMTENLGIAAVAPVLAGQQEISIDGTPPRLRMLRPFRLIIPLVLLLILLMSLMYGKVKWDIAGLKEDHIPLSVEIDELKKELAPLEQKRGNLRKSTRLQEDIHAFMETRPQLFTYINEMARHVPEGTWFSHFSYEKDTMTLKGESPDALETIESLRSSELFDQIDLKGQVNRTPSGAEKFSIIIKLKDNEADK
ncbi:MAG: PilN domain-containing protein [Deltaproteobacteria bacterium]|nr:PilN domain-containing protein [Deltaproteobacteria bacterium]